MVITSKTLINMLRFAAIIILVGLPVLEVVLLVRVAMEVGWWLPAYLVVAAVLGASILQQERAAWPGRLLGEAPLSALFVTGRRLVAAVLLILPGLLSDVAALVLLLWPTRREPAASPDRGVIEGEFRRED